MFFYGTWVKNPTIDNLLDLARLVNEPDYARKSHITLRGPYKQKPRPNSKWLKTKIGPAIISKPDIFFNDFQSTVFLRTEIVGIADIWKKPDYPDGIPHLSIYDGKDREFAWLVFGALKEFSWQLELDLVDVAIIEKKNDLVTSYIWDQKKIDDGLEQIGAQKYSIEQLRKMHIGQRIKLLRDICNQIHFRSTPDHQSSSLF